MRRRVRDPVGDASTTLSVEMLITRYPAWRSPTASRRGTESAPGKRSSARPMPFSETMPNSRGPSPTPPCSIPLGVPSSPGAGDAAIEPLAGEGSAPGGKKITRGARRDALKMLPATIVGANTDGVVDTGEAVGLSAAGSIGRTVPRAGHTKSVAVTSAHAAASASNTLAVVAPSLRGRWTSIMLLEEDRRPKRQRDLQHVGRASQGGVLLHGHAFHVNHSRRTSQLIQQRSQTHHIAIGDQCGRQ